MRILVHEFFSGGGLAGLAGRPGSRSLAREGAAMLAALVSDLAAVPDHQIVTTRDPRVALRAPAGVEVVPLPRSSNRPYPRNLDPLISAADAVWLIAPETDGWLERLTARIEKKSVALLGSTSTAIRAVSDKGRLARVLGRHRVPHPVTRSVLLGRPGKSWQMNLDSVAKAVGFPMVTKPARGAGCEGVWLVRDARDLGRAVDAARKAGLSGRLLLQRYVSGAAASVSLLADGQRAAALAVNSQCMRSGRPFSYQGGRTPFEHPLARTAAETAVRACEAVPGLRGYVGVDVVLGGSEAVVIEINPRLTTAYLGVRKAVRANVAAMAIAACDGDLPIAPATGRAIRFFPDGRVLA